MDTELYATDSHDAKTGEGSDCPLVSVVIPTYNRAHLIGDAIESVIRQTYRNIEVIIVDDGSTDGTDAIVRAFQDARVRYIRMPANRGACAARNLGWRQAAGRFIVFHDSDDALDARRLELQVKRLVQEEADMCSGSILVLPDKRVQYRCPSRSSDVMLDFLTGRVHGGTQCWMIRRDLIDSIGGYDEHLVCCQDLDLTFRLLVGKPRVAFEPEAFTLFNKHGGDRITLKKYTEEGMRSIFRSHANRVRTLTHAFRDAMYRDAENQQVLRLAAYAYAKDLHGLARDFQQLSRELQSRRFPGRTWGRRMCFRFLGVRGMGMMVKLSQRIA
jgi:glycosyltransferase involved in cell wall biosynthesis